MNAAINNVLEAISNVMYSYVLIVLLIATGLYFFIRTKGLPLRLLPDAVRSMREAPHKENGISSFRALMVSTASRVGIGNIAGVATAIALGGAGAVFWMWLIALLGAATAFVESTLAQIYKRRAHDGHSYGGPAYYIADALKLPWLGYIFACALILTYVGGFNLVAAYTVNDTLTSYGFYNPEVTPYVTGVVLAVLVAIAIFGGIRRLSAITAIVVPVMAAGYVLLCIVVIIANAGHIPAVFAEIFRSAFDFHAIFGGFAGSALMLGIKRGLYSNEAGVGSAPNAAATASVSHPVKQGLVQMLSVWIDTMLICTATALAVLSTGVEGSDKLNGAPFVQAAWSTVFGQAGQHLVTLALFLFAFTTLIGNYSYAEANLHVVLRRTPSRMQMTVFRIVCAIIVFLGCISEFGLAWNAADVIMGVMVLINVPSILVLGKHALVALEDYLRQSRAGKDPVYIAAENGVREKTAYWHSREEIEANQTSDV